MVALSFFGAAGALARSENAGVAFFVQRLRPRARAARRRRGGAGRAGRPPRRWRGTRSRSGVSPPGQTTGSGLPLELTFYPMGAGALCMTIFALRAILSPAAAGSLRSPSPSRWRWPARRTAGASSRPGACALGPADARGLRRLPRRRRADRLRAGVHRADLHLDRGRAARRDLRPADGARHRQFRAARDPVLHPGRLPDGGERHVRSPDRAAANAWSGGCAAGSTW